MSTLTTARRPPLATMNALLSPRTVVVVGSHRTPGDPAGTYHQALRMGQFCGTLAQVDPTGASDGFRSVGEVPWRPDLAILAVPGPHLLAALDDCADAGVRAVAVVTATSHDEGLQLSARASRRGLLMIGPGSLGVLNPLPLVRLNATAIRHGVRAAGAVAEQDAEQDAGRVAGVAVAVRGSLLATQLLEEIWRRSLPLSGFVDLGDAANVSAQQVMSCWGHGTATQVVILGSSCLTAGLTAEVLSRVVPGSPPHPPLVVLDEGNLAPAQRRCLSALGVIVTESVAESLDVAKLLITQTPPEGSGLLIISDDQAGAMAAARTAALAGAELCHTDHPLRRTIDSLLPASSWSEGVLYLGDQVGPEHYELAVRALRDDGSVHAALLIQSRTGSRHGDDMVAALHQLLSACSRAHATGMLMAAALVDSPAPADGLPWYPDEQKAVRALVLASTGGAGHRPVGGGQDQRGDAPQP
ncbi:CoA-binding protein [Kineosporia sp. NBRC 101731]|uniref:CoA-binding protein n=1 Tax=Kineosporia sp. NBRC 101731 TaxID=3032199 RepID=UPI0024A1B003|nr:CoA-binding protein [Kineosporia sp. NBRC 101731]GLY32169.1 hypothetical protein Kisp02_55340 [Kineosporia sp. NBRC 101731]